MNGQPSEATLLGFLRVMPAVLYEFCKRQDGTGTLIFVSDSCLAMLGRPPSFFIGNIDRFMSIIHPDDLERFCEKSRSTVNDNEFATEARVILPSSESRWMRFTSKPVPGRSDNSDVFWSGCITDITALKQAEEKINRLQGILSTCSCCKMIRLADHDPTDSASWVPIESYITDHCNAKFSHGLCPECFQRNYGETAWREYLREEPGQM
ncbi:MAG: PAS domain-containing protein [Pontiellaceae bacterium]|nr:PAS domain-containing protein [Pontiellaceae bacterium]